jgi:hypothetical protein
MAVFAISSGGGADETQAVAERAHLKDARDRDQASTQMERVRSTSSPPTTGLLADD